MDNFLKILMLTQGEEKYLNQEKNFPKVFLKLPLTMAGKCLIFKIKEKIERILITFQN